MRLIFMGTPEFAVRTLAAVLNAGHDIACVYSQPPRPAGRGMNVKPSPVQAWAEARGINVRTPANFKSIDEQQKFAALEADAAIVVAYGLLLPKAILDAPKHGCFNVHASLLPRWRGAAPLQRAIMSGDKETGVSIMRMDEGLDTGPVVKTIRIQIKPDTTAGSLHDTLAALGAAAMVDALRTPPAPGVAQVASGVTYASKIDKAEARIDFGQSAVQVRNHIHGLSPYPGAWFSVGGTRIKVLAASLAAGEGVPGTALENPFTIACGSGAIRFLKLQREGKAALGAEEFARGFTLAFGTRVD
jgi:methionyl-tRNA formyltransferase